MDNKFSQTLKKNGLTKTEFAARCGISRPTLNKLIKRFDETGSIEEPYKTVFEAFFSEKQVKVERNYRCLNNNLIVRIVEDTTVNSNGTRICGSETRGKRDIVSAEIIASGNTNIKDSWLVYFSFYAAQPVVLDGEQLYIVNYQDIKFVKEDHLSTLAKGE